MRKNLKLRPRVGGKREITRAMKAQFYEDKTKQRVRELVDEWLEVKGNCPIKK